MAAVKQLEPEELVALIKREWPTEDPTAWRGGIPTDADVIHLVNAWLERGDGVAIYRNEDLGHPDLGFIKVVSFGSSESQLETDEPPTTLPDIGGSINWRYQLEATYRGAPL